MVGIYLPLNASGWLIPGPHLFLAIHALGIASFIYVVSRRLVPLLQAQADPRFDHPFVRLGRVLKFWLGQWKHPRYKFAGTLHILIFAGFILLALRAFSVLIVGVSREFRDARPFGRIRLDLRHHSPTTPRPSSSSAWWSPRSVVSFSSPPGTRCPRSTAKVTPPTPSFSWDSLHF